jgi:hypothetical protein
MYDRAWLLLDNTLSDPEVCSPPGDCKLVMEHKLRVIPATDMETRLRMTFPRSFI